MDERSEFHISERRLQQIGMIAAGLLLLFSILGYMISPRDSNGQPILLLPEVKAFGDYQNSARGWIYRLNTLDSEIVSVMSGIDHGDLFSQSHQTQEMLQHAVDLVKEIDQVTVPAAASGLHDQMYATALGYLETTRLVMRWVGAPETATKDQINLKLEQVRLLRSSLEKSQWINLP